MPLAVWTDHSASLGATVPTGGVGSALESRAASNEARDRLRGGEPGSLVGNLLSTLKSPDRFLHSLRFAS
jgi:hypothetical protein